MVELIDGNLLTIEEIASYLRVCRRTAWRWCKSGKLPAFKLGHEWRVSRQELERIVRPGGADK
ncbi:MAG: helix-turn-helix domain-containing protein [Chloroflexi bacterium]|nr:helix-turn-helix domain-containing protein [Chloroflexota bacterium]